MDVVTSGARGLGILIVLSFALGIIALGLRLALTAPLLSGGHLTGAGLILAGGLLLARLWAVQRRAILHVRDDGSRIWWW